jgi:spermidine/putrescine ABC transporter ATP-binding subunit
MTAETTTTERAGTATEPLVRIRSLGCSYGDVRALDEVSLDIGGNEFFALLGPSGCGKTTLLRSLAGFEAPDAGTVTLDGLDLLALPAHRRPVNMMFQSYALFPHLSVEKNVAYGLQRAGLPKPEITDRVDRVLETVGLDALRKRKPHQLSGGQKQRVALARAIVNRPRLLLLDEPMSALDKKVREEMQIELKRLQHEVGIAFVMVTHDQEEALSMADRIAVLDQGRVQQVASPLELYRRPANRFVAEFVGSSNVLTGAPTARGVDVADLGDLPGTPVTGAGPGETGVAHLVVRPEDVRIVDEGGLLRGRVLESQFAGGLTTIAVELEGVADAPRRPVLVRHPGFAGVDRGADVSLSWDPALAPVVP